MTEHKNGNTLSTKGKNPELVYYEAFSNKNLAYKREWSLKHSGSVYVALLKRLGLK